MEEISLEVSRHLCITRIDWNGSHTLRFILRYGQFCKAGVNDSIEGHSFDPAKKITRVECFIDLFEENLDQINFYSGAERLVFLGMDDDCHNDSGRRQEVFDIATDKVLIGCKSDIINTQYVSMTWLKTKVMFD